MALGHSAGGSDLLGNEYWLLLSEAAWENTCIVCCCWYFPSNSGVLVLLSFHHSDCLNLWRIPSLRILNEKSWKCIFGTWGAVQPIPGLPPHGAASRTVLLNSTVAKPPIPEDWKICAVLINHWFQEGPLCIKTVMSTHCMRATFAKAWPDSG